MKMSGAMHPPCRRKKLRPLRPRLTARTPLCSVPSSSPHAAGRAGAPRFFLPEENETAPAGACRRPTAAKRRLSGRRQTGRARSKREKEGTGDNAGMRLNDRRSRNDPPRAIGLSGGCPMTNGPAPLSAAADLVVGGVCPPFSGSALLSVEHLVGPDPLVRPFLQGLPSCQQNTPRTQPKSVRPTGRTLFSFVICAPIPVQPTPPQFQTP